MDLPPTIAASQDPATYVALLLGGMVLIYLSVLRPMMKKRKKDPLEDAPFRAGLSQQRALERDMQNVLVEYEKMIRNMTAGLDTRAAKLEILLKEADEKLAALRAAQPSSGSNGVHAPTPPVGETTNLRTPVVDPPASAPPGGPDPRHAEIYALIDQGLSVRDVAKRLNRQDGEITLILNLRARGRHDS